MYDNYQTPPMADSDPEPRSLITPLGYWDGSSCGYCKNSEPSERDPWSYHARSRSIRVLDYQTLLDRGWRRGMTSGRAGTHLYKTNPLASCCAQYTIRIDAREFKASRDQRHALNKWNRHVLGEKYSKEAAKAVTQTREEKRAQKSFDLLKAVHEAERPLFGLDAEYKLEVTLESNEITKEKHEVYQDYQVHVHHDLPSECNEEQLERFLCTSPLKSFDYQDPETGKTRKVGSYHQCYRLNGRLIAVAVLDLLPNCVSGVYFFHHSDFLKHQMAKLGALREIALALEEGYHYYYMGYYVATCQKMLYKATYNPHYILDPETYDWNLLTAELKVKLAEMPYYSPAAAKLTPTPYFMLESYDPATDKPQVREGHETEQKEPHEQGFEPLLFYPRMPGTLTVREIEGKFDIGDLLICAHGKTFVLKYTNLWDDAEHPRNLRIKLQLNELVSVIGVELAARVIVDFDSG